MRNTKIALAVLALVASTAAMAEGVKISGQIDIGVMNTSKTAAGLGGTFIEQGALLDHSSVALSASEDLSNGMKAFTTLEAGFNANGFTDNGGGGFNTAATAAGTGALFNRQAFVGVSGDFGSVAFGRQLSPFILSQALTNFGVGSFWVSRLAVGNSAGGFSSTGTGITASGFFPANGISYTSPSINGFTVRGLTTTGQGTNNNGLSAYSDSNRFDSVSIDGNIGSAFVSAAYQSTKNAYSSYSVGANVQIVDGLSAIANYMKDTPETGTAVGSYAVGAKYALMSGTDAILQYAANNASGNNEKTLTNLTIVHSLSKRSSVYAMVGSGKNTGSSIGNFGNNYAGKTNSTYGVGVAHSF